MDGALSKKPNMWATLSVHALLAEKSFSESQSNAEKSRFFTIYPFPVLNYLGFPWKPFKNQRNA